MTSTSLIVHEHFIPNQDGWLLQVKQTYAPAKLDRGRPPLIIIPGYGMNTFIFGYHPRGTSMERVFAEAGYEVWSANLRRQGGSLPESKLRAPTPSIRAYAETDLTAVIEATLQRTESARDRVCVVGCSLGGSFSYAHLSLIPQHYIQALVTIGSPLRWENAHPLIRFAFRSSTIAGIVPFAGTRRLATLAFPLITRAPWLLSTYMNINHVDLSQAKILTRTVDDPHPRLNRDLAKWLHRGDMILRGINITQAVRSVDVPLLLVLANRDGVVPAASTLSAEKVWGGKCDILKVGNNRQWYAHADLFIGNNAKEHVFSPILDWLKENAP